MANRPGTVNTILFDLDDTLLDSIGAREQALNKVFLPLNIPGFDAPQFLQDLKGRQIKDVLAEIAL
ncbi:MAG TPA: hypothetical protein VMB24_01200, partial [Dehalococcoidales bacterium]|nr:hypothetical protein [Dehalococcoidales bacterium]